MKASGDQQDKFTAETRSRGEDQKFTTEARRHGEESGDRVIARERVIGKDAYRCHPERVGANATPSRRTPTKIVPEHTASGSSHETLKYVLVAAWQTFRATLREIFDESAYDRFLQRTKAPRSVTSYRDFMQEREAGMTRRPKCC
jgi:hypothetical protein